MASRPSHLQGKFSRLGGIVILLLLLLGGLITWHTINRIRREMKADLLIKARIAAQSINTDRLQNLSGSSSDIGKEDYQRIKQQLLHMRKAQQQCKFLYLMGKNEQGRVFFFIDSQPEDSEDYAPPGLIYEEVPTAYLKVFKTHKAKTVGPVEDRWGRLMTALIPVTEPGSEKLIALLGMDMTTNEWTQEIVRRTAPTVIGVLLTLILVYYIQQMRLLKNRKKSEAQIRQREEQYQALFEQAADGILIGDETGRIVDANNSIARMTGYSKDELIGSNMKTLFTEAQLQENPLSYNAVLSGETVLNERKLTRKNGEEIFIEMHTKKVGERRLQTFIRDITERKRAEHLLKEKNDELTAAEEELKVSNEELRATNETLARQKAELKAAKEKAEESDKLKTVFLANMSHEIRTPINGIVGFAEVLVSQSFLEEERKEYLNTIRSLAYNLMQIIDDIIDISKIEAGQLKVNKETAYINDILDELYKLYSMQLEQDTDKAVELRVHKSFERENSKIYTDAIRLKQILGNLLGNARKFTRKGYIDIGYKLRSQHEWLFWVEDTGIGIPEEEQPYIFERFRQAGNVSEIEQAGTGLGLTISQNLTNLLGGTIWMQTTPGKGSVFWFTIPYKPAHSKLEIPERRATESYNWAGKTILIVEDNRPARAYLRSALKNTGASLILKETAEEGLEVFASDKTIHLIIMDIRLPGMQGDDAIRDIRKKDEEIPIIVLTAYSMSKERSSFLKAGATDYLAKPVAMKILLSTLGKYI